MSSSTRAAPKKIVPYITEHVDEESETYSGNDEWVPDYKPVTLRDTQISACKGLKTAILNFGICFNSTPTGGGKTPQSFWLAQQISEYLDSDVKILVVGPSTLNVASTTSPWYRESNEFGMPLDGYITFETLRGKSSAIATSKSPKVISTFHGNVPHVEGQTSYFGYDNIVNDFTWVDEDEQELYTHRKGKEMQMFYSSKDAAIMRKDILTRNDTTDKYEYISEYSPTMELMQYFMDHNVCLFIEEVQFAKNPTSTNSAIGAIFRAARRAWTYKENSGSYIGILSATPLDAKKNALNFFRMLGMSDPVHTGQFNDMFVTNAPWPLQNVYKEAQIYAPAKAKSIAKHFNVSKNGTFSNEASAKNEIAMQFLVQCVMYRIHYAALNITPKQIWNAFLDITSKEDIKNLKRARELLEEVKLLQEQKSKPKVFKVLSEAHGLMEDAMVDATTLDAITRLRDDPNCKVIIVFSRIKSVNKCMEILLNAGYGDVSVRIAGDTSAGKDDAESDDDDDDNKRKKGITKAGKDIALESFQEDSNNTRVLVGIMSRLSTGIDLHNTAGKHQRWTYIIVNFKRLESEQVIGRTPRDGSVTIPQILICYPKTLGSLIMRVYEGYQTKSAVLARVLASRISEKATVQEKIIHNALVKTPDQYDVYIQLSCPELEYYQGSPSYDYRTKRVLPEDPEDYFYIGEYNDNEGRENFSDIKYVIEYLEGECAYPAEERQGLNGIIFTAPESPNVNPLLLK